MLNPSAETAPEVEALARVNAAYMEQQVDFPNDGSPVTLTVYERDLRQVLRLAALSSLNEARKALETLIASCTRTKPALHDDCGTRIVTAPSVEALKEAREALAKLGPDK